jgi:hypothetical protein
MAQSGFIVYGGETSGRGRRQDRTLYRHVRAPRGFVTVLGYRVGGVSHRSLAFFCRLRKLFGASLCQLQLYSSMDSQDILLTNMLQLHYAVHGPFFHVKNERVNY